jgi:predicted O-methyltransferase YrrM|tara:strand:+ start:2043 stop:2651 length:609 start_codon:yes stop_codon:yes gene_type:complete
MTILNTVKGFLDNSEAKKLAELINLTANLGPGLEIGSYCGKSALIFGEACKQNNSFFFTVDHHTGSEEHQVGEEYHDADLYDSRLGKFNTLPELLKNINQSPMQNNIIPVVGDSASIAKKWKIPLGLLFIDGGHSMEAALNDYHGWNEFIIPGGLLAIHDVFPNPRDGGRPPYEIYSLAKKSGNYEEIEMVKSLAILRKIIR